MCATKEFLVHALIPERLYTNYLGLDHIGYIGFAYDAHIRYVNESPYTDTHITTMTITGQGNGDGTSPEQKGFAL